MHHSNDVDNDDDDHHRHQLPVESSSYSPNISFTLSSSSSSPSSITLPSLCSSTNSYQKLSTTITSSDQYYYQDYSHRGKRRRQVSSPLEIHNKLNNENDLLQTPSKNRRCSSFNSQKCLTSKQSMKLLNNIHHKNNNNNNNSSGK
ncbi:unnamed protein product [Schistosoma turkestanicum]|nr:unnamed protein product [Schistosoma turkestanicum]